MEKNEDLEFQISGALRVKTKMKRCDKKKETDVCKYKRFTRQSTGTTNSREGSS